MTALLGRGVCLIPRSVLTQRHREHQYISPHVEMQGQQLDTIAEHERINPEYAVLFAPPESIEDRAGGVESTAATDKLINPGIPSRNGIRRVLGDLETCAEDLLIFVSSSDSEQRVLISRSKLRSCREAIFSIIRWFETQRKDIRISHGKNPYSPNSNLEDGSPAGTPDNGVGPRNKRAAIGISEQQQLCEANVCRSVKSSQACAKARSMTREEIKLCSMCRPRNEGLIRKHCAKQHQPQQNVLYILLALLAALSGAAGVFVLIRKAKGQRSELRPGPCPSFNSQQGILRQGVITGIQRSRSLIGMPDVEKNPGIGSNRPQLQTRSLHGSQRGITDAEMQMYNHEGQGSRQLAHSDSLKLRGGTGKKRPTTPTACIQTQTLHSF
ncbi:hypothetical protein PAAG_08663 [Paracoccidioides lutzii Pb01]|uniref:Uncharacterized protein n=1 Tax=Paracoccidioides lutzii (strain ATCC MYA-826 / Pb01) TaxID=502779 RepID=C1HD22_PARBA|nr:hypothetical protein PAAG_08663 [Paracoccidioides lutzii Pb01]EEH39394.2 hypothetical protein PAAG_08663 [Paracoccidioides lutzii Pb01]